ncbi:MAG TPA: HIT domain-containing protein [Patescibacteria group bacterium]|nr:HIT domain-containing protein [Patescibacteria group bacterium]
MENCIFCLIVNKTLPSDKVFEDDSFIIIKDKYPKAPVHLLVIPKKHLDSLSQADSADKDLLGGLLLLVKAHAKAIGVAENGYKVTINVGSDGGQTIPHLHIHLKAGKKFEE